MTDLSSSRTIKTWNPYTKKEISTYEIFSEKKIEDILLKSEVSFKEWRHTSFKERAFLLQHVADKMESLKVELSSLITEEMGKTFKEALSEVAKSIEVCRYYAGVSEDVLNRKINTEDSFVCYQPLGTILAVMPWNYPFWQVFRFLAPTIMSGNVALLRHASNVTGCALAIEKLFLECGSEIEFLKKTFKGEFNIFQIVLCESSRVKSLIKDFRVRGVSFTGSTSVGRKIASLSGEFLKPCVLELGGNDPAIVCKDYDLEKALEHVVSSRFSNAGQSCIATKRLFVHESKKNETVELLQKILKLKNYGDPFNEHTDLAPMAKAQFKEELKEQIDRAEKEGAKYTVLKALPQESSDSLFFECGLLSNVLSNNSVFDEEIFGPVLVLHTYENINEALELANASKFGLGASIFSNDLEWSKETAAFCIEAGAVSINQKLVSKQERPFGGVKNSGFGRELGVEALFEFVNVKSISH